MLGPLEVGLAMTSVSTESGLSQGRFAAIIYLSCDTCSHLAF
jgi:hypothetical protein